MTATTLERPRDIRSAAFLTSDLSSLMSAAATARDLGHGRLQTWSPKVFIPLTQLCRNLCHYCTFSQPHRSGRKAFLTRDEVLSIAREGRAAGCTEALFTLGDKPELRFPVAQAELQGLGHETTVEYLAEMCAAVLTETGLLPHVNAGVLSRDDLVRLRTVSASMGLMLESASDRLCLKGGPHYRSPDKAPSARLETLRLAGELAIPFTTGILIGIGETREERIAALKAIRDLHIEYGHIQEVIIQNFRAKAGTVMADRAEPGRDELLWTIAVARLIFGPEMSLQAPPNLSDDDFGQLMDAGINDWGGVSPVTPDHVNPERPWPDVARLQAVTEARGRILAPRLPVSAAFVQEPTRWFDAAVRPSIRASADASGLARDDAWSPGTPLAKRPRASADGVDVMVAAVTARSRAGELLSHDEIVRLFAARGPDLEHVLSEADALRLETQGDVVTYVVNRNINYTNICNYRCGFCAFAKGDKAPELRGSPYDLDVDEVVRRVVEARDRGATEVCLQGGIHPHYTGQTYLALTRAVRAAVPEIHIHAFSPLEIWQGAQTLGLDLEEYLRLLKDAGLNSLPGTAAEILDDEVRAVLCPDKLDTMQWLEVIEVAHRIGLRTTATIMFGHIDQPKHWARHLIAIRDLQRRTGGFTEFVPLPFIHMQAPNARRGEARLGPTWREVALMHAVSRLVLHPHLTSIQTSWVKLGAEGVKACLQAGANDIGGSLMDESISRAAGAKHGQEMPPVEMTALIKSIHRIPRQRTTLYGEVDPLVRARGQNPVPLTPTVQTPPRRRAQHSFERPNHAS